MCHSFIVSLVNVNFFINEYVEIGKKQIPISRTYKKVVLGLLGVEL